MIKPIVHLFLLLFVLPATAKVEFKNIKLEHINFIKTKFPKTLASKNVSYKQLDRLIRYIMSTGQYERVSVYKLKPDLYKIQANSLKFFGEVDIKGDNEVSGSLIEDSLEVKKGENFDRRRVLKSGEKIKELYTTKGFYNTKVNIKFSDQPGNKVDVDFIINENQPCEIKNIFIQTENKRLQARLQDLLKAYVNETYTNKRVIEIEKDINEYLKDKKYITSYLDLVKVEFNQIKSKSTLYYKILRPYSYNIFFKGNNQLSVSELYRAIDLETFGVSSLNPEQDIVSKIKNKYLSLGYAHVKLKSNTQLAKKKFTRDINLSIQEGARVKVAKVKVKGQISRDEDYYIDFIKKNSSDTIKSGYYNAKDLEVGFKNLKTTLQNQGYLKAKIQSVRIEFTKNKKIATIIILMDEGPLTQVRSIRFNGNKNFSQSALIDSLKIKINEPLKQNFLIESIDNLKKFYRRLGYLEMKLLNEDETLVRYNKRGTIAHINFKIYEGPKIIVSSIEVKGNIKIDKYIVLKELEFEVGDILTPEDLEESIARLNKLGLFANTEIRTLEEGTNISQRTVRVTVSERSPGLFRTGIGLNNKRGLTGRMFVGTTYNNIDGTARAISGRVDLNMPLNDKSFLENKFTAGYLEPYIFNTRTRGHVNYVHSESLFDSEEDNGEEILSINRSDQISFILENSITSHITLNWVLWSFDSNLSYQSPRTLSAFNTSRVQIGTIGPSIDIDFRDSPFLPTKGHHTFWDLDYSDKNLGNTYSSNNFSSNREDLLHFIRTEGGFTHYKPFSKNRVVWANSLRGGYIQNLLNTTENPLSGVPASKAFFLGGFTTVRGFGGLEQDDYIPKQQSTLGGANELIIKGFSNYYLVKSELRISLFDPYGMVIFYDGGEVTIKNPKDTYPIKGYRHSVGLGLRFNTPVGPISLDYGWKLGALAHGENSGAFHFSIGTF